MVNPIKKKRKEIIKQIISLTEKLIKNLKCEKYNFFITNNIKEKNIINTVSGRYNADDFIENGTNFMAPGKISIEGIEKEIDFTIIFQATRYEEVQLMDEGIRILSNKGSLEAEALYKDTGGSNVSEADFALYEILTTTGEFREMKGHFLKIEFNNTEPCKPRKISLVEGFGPNKKDAKIFP